MTKRRFHRKLLPGILLHGKQIWLSELLAVFLVTLILLPLAGMGTRIASNAVRLRGVARAISETEREDLELTNRLHKLGSQYRLLAAFREFARKKVPEDRLLQLVDLVHRNSQQFGYDPLLVLAVIRVESYFDPRALGRYKSGRESGALGLMQLKYATAQLVAAELQVQLKEPADLFKPDINIALGIGYLTKQISFFKSFKLGLLAYNMGPGTVLQSINEKKPLPAHYYENVLKHYFKLKRISKAKEEELHKTL